MPQPKEMLSGEMTGEGSGVYRTELVQVRDIKTVEALLLMLLYKSSNLCADWI